MPHAYNQRVFAVPEFASPLLAVYLSLVAIELALKNRQISAWSQGHDIALMIADFGDASLTALSAQARARLESLWCERKGGGAERVSARNYPGIRYLRHHTDHAVHASVDADVEAALAAVDALRSELTRRGVL